MNNVRELRIFGFDKTDMTGTAAALKKLGFSSVVGHGAGNAAAFFAEEGLDYYAVQGCFGVDESIDFPENLCVDIEGNRTKWFGSACPNSPAAIAKCLADARKLAAGPHLSGIIVDGARFASPASAEGANAFFTCFCDHCQAKMHELGYSSEKITASVSALKTGQGFEPDVHREGILDWLAFRREVITGHLARYIQSIREVNPALRVGMYIFPPSIATLVGQSYADLAKLFDFLSPMVYRHYDEGKSPACLDHEIVALLKQPIFDLYKEITGLPFGEMPSVDDFAKTGCPVSYVENEIATAVEQAATGHATVFPILLLKDAALAQCIQACLSQGIKDIDFFMYDRGILEAKTKEFAKIH